MEIRITTKQVLGVLLIMAWLLFVGICIEAGAFITNAVFALLRPATVPYLWHQVDLSALFKASADSYFVLCTILGIVSVLKACLFYLIIRALSSKRLDVSQPFREEGRRLMVSLSYVCLLIGLFSASGGRYAGWLSGQGVPMPDAEHLSLGGSDVWLFMSVVLFIMTLLFKKGMQLQAENDLTI